MTHRDMMCTTEQAFELKKLGILQKSVFFYKKEDTIEFQAVWVRIHINHNTGALCILEEENSAAAFTCYELGIMLPDINEHGELINSNWIDEAFGEPGRQFFGSLPVRELQIGFKSEAECRAAILLYLIKNKQTTVEEINNRLIKPQYDK